MAQTIDGFTIDLNRITRREFRKFTDQLRKVETKSLAADELTGDFIEKTVTEWPFNAPITKDGYLNLPLENSMRCDDAVTLALETISQKK